MPHDTPASATLLGAMPSTASTSDVITSRATSARPTSPSDEVVLLDPTGRPNGTARKDQVHGQDTPFHLAISCYVVRADGAVLVSRRSAAKVTWPGIWTNGCCGHPRPGESLEEAVCRHLFDELHLRPRRLQVVLPDFAYRATMANGVVEHELCPVFIAEVDGDPTPNPEEVDAVDWQTWAELRRRAAAPDSDLSPWSRTQIARMEAMITDPLEWVRRPEPIAPERFVTSPPCDPFAVMGTDLEQLIEEFIDGAVANLATYDPLAPEMAAPLRALFRAGGKRLRPCLVYCGFQAAESLTDASCEQRENVANVAAAVEMLHTFALLHDDIMDRSATRRGQPTAHIRFAAMHDSCSAKGDSEWFGLSAAVVAGDLAFVWADQLLDRVRRDPATVEQLRGIYAALRNEVIAGQYLDIRLAGSAATDVQALTVALLKSGRYTVTRPLELGATLAAASDRVIDALRTYGDAIGVAFQLRDDVLGVFGDSALTGKGAADDLTSGKASLLLVRARELARPAHRAVLERCLGEPGLDEERIEECREAIRASGALASIERLIDANHDAAIAALGGLPESAREHLGALAPMLAHRDR